jgi:hypothetical protein
MSIPYLRPWNGRPTAAEAERLDVVRLIWRKVYLVPTGHPVVSMQIKTLVYRVLRMNTIDLVYLNGVYYTLDLDQREVAIAAVNSRADGSGDGDD